MSCPDAKPAVYQDLLMALAQSQGQSFNVSEVAVHADLPAGVAQQGGDPAIAVTVIAAGQLDHLRDQAVLVVTAARDTALGRAVLPQHPAGPPFRDPEPVTDMVDALAAPRRA